MDLTKYQNRQNQSKTYIYSRYCSSGKSCNPVKKIKDNPGHLLFD